MTEISSSSRNQARHDSLSIIWEWIPREPETPSFGLELERDLVWKDYSGQGINPELYHCVILLFLKNISKWIESYTLGQGKRENVTDLCMSLKGAAVRPFNPILPWELWIKASTHRQAGARQQLIWEGLAVASVNLFLSHGLHVNSFGSSQDYRSLGF